MIVIAFVSAADFKNDPLFQQVQIYHQGDLHYLMPDGQRLVFPDPSLMSGKCDNSVEKIVANLSQDDIDCMFDECKIYSPHSVGRFIFELKMGFPAYIANLIDHGIADAPKGFLESVTKRFKQIRPFYAKHLEADIKELLELAYNFEKDVVVLMTDINDGIASKDYQSSLVRSFITKLTASYQRRNNHQSLANPLPPVYLSSLIKQMQSHLVPDMFEDFVDMLTINDAFSHYRQFYPLSLALVHPLIPVPNLRNLGFGTSETEVLNRQVDSRYLQVYALATSGWSAYGRFMRALDAIDPRIQRAIETEMIALPSLNIKMADLRATASFYMYPSISAILVSMHAGNYNRDIYLSAIISVLVLNSWANFEDNCCGERFSINDMIRALNASGLRDLALRDLQSLDTKVASPFLGKWISILKSCKSPIYPLYIDY